MSMLIIINVIIIIIDYSLITNIDDIEKSIKMGVSACKSNNTTYYRAGSIYSGSLFHADYGCNRRRMTRGSQCASFEVHPMIRREDMSNLLLLMCYKGGALYAGSIIYITIYLLLLRSIMVHWIGENIIFNNQPGYGSRG